MRRFLLVIFIVAILVAGGLGAWGFMNNKLEGEAPEIILAENVTHLGKNTQLVGKIVDEDSGLRNAKITIVQNHREIVLWQEDFSGQDDDNAVTSESAIDLSINASELGLVQGPATLIIESHDNAWRRWGKGNTVIKEVPVQVVLVPPRASLLNSNIYINRSGVGLALYRVTDSVNNSGIKLGDDFYPGFAAWPDYPNIRVAYFAFPDTVDKNAQPRLVAMDHAGNQSTVSVPIRLRWREFKTDNISLSDNFLNMVADRFADTAPAGSPLEIFIWVNTKLREQSGNMLKQATSNSEPRQLWRGAFLRPSGKMMSDFVEHRTYTYHGKPEGKSTHYGLDLADVTHASVRAAAAGRVAFAGDMGVYGNTVVIDHGLNLFTLYAHLSSIDAAVGQNVDMGQRIGVSGSTGFSFGDHLHFACMIGDKFVTPYEWLDSHWIADNVELQYKQAGMTAPN